MFYWLENWIAEKAVNNYLVRARVRESLLIEVRDVQSGGVILSGTAESLFYRGIFFGGGVPAGRVVVELKDTREGWRK
jgi:hypothetical protein